MNTAPLLGGASDSSAHCPHKTWLRRRFNYFFLIALIVCTSVLTYLTYYLSTFGIFFSSRFHVPDEKQVSKVIKGQLFITSDSKNIYCKIPKLDPFDPSIKHLIDKDISKIHCNKTTFPKEIFDGQYGLNPVLIQLRKPEKFGWKDCFYQVVKRVDGSDSDEELSEETFPLLEKSTPIPKEHEFIAVSCVNATANKSAEDDDVKSQIIDVFAFTPLKPSVEKRIAHFYSKNGTLKEKDRVNLVIIGLDSLSHMNLQRVMPKVHKYLIHNLSALWMDGYTKVGVNTLPNMIVALSSMTLKEANSTCIKNKSYDKCPLIWKNFAKNGYRTFYAEDWPAAATFNYLMKGFKYQQPTDYYLRPLARIANEFVKNGPKNMCYGPRLTLQFLINYMKSAMMTMGKDKRYFQYIWSTALTHDVLNMGGAGESAVLSFLHWMNRHDYFNNTAFVFISDHGFRFGKIRHTHQGKLEGSLPFIYFVLPKWFKTKYKTAVKNMKRNRVFLTSPHDTYQTFNDILNLGNLDEKKIVKRIKELEKLSHKNKLPRGISMFLPIPETRTCEMAQIEENYCVCHTTTNISVEDEQVKEAANFAVSTINSYITSQPKCAELSLNSVDRAEEISIIPSQNLTQNDTKMYQVSFTVKPSKGKFEATVINKEEDEEEENWNVVGKITRTNLYGNQSYCVDTVDLKNYCYCL